MSFAARVLSELEEGKWTLSSIAPSFERRLAGEIKTQASGKNISELCMSFYGKKPPQIISVRQDKKDASLDSLSSDVQYLIQTILRPDYPDSSVINFEPEFSQKLYSALKLIGDTTPHTAKLIDDLVMAFMRVNEVTFRSASHPHLFGLILLGDKATELTFEQLAVSVVHELAHQELFLVNMLDRLVNQPFDYNEVHAPFQGVKRPPIGRLHSLWALYRMLEFQIENNSVNEKYRELLEQNARAFESGELTPFAKKLVEIAVRRVG